jgi:hypothetical protein
MVSRVEGASVRRIEEGLRSAPLTEGPKPREYIYDGPPPPAEVIQRQIAAMAVLPSALAIACEKHGAAVGEKCFGAGVCGDRLNRRGGAS